MKIYKAIPNTLTCCNLLCGCISIWFISNGLPLWAGIMIFVGAIFDFLDGFAARLLDAHSPIGADLDSLADVVTFGVAPGFIMFDIIEQNHYGTMEPSTPWLAFMAFLLPVFSALRLAKFNIDTRQTTYFIGLPTPAMAVFVASLPIAMRGYDGLWCNIYLCAAIVILFSALMVCNIKFFSFKIKNIGWRGNEYRWIFLALAIALLVVMKLMALPFIMLAYIIISLCSSSRIC